MELGATIKHNKDNSPKTGDWKIMQPEVDAIKCIGCGTCVGHCPEAAIILELGAQNAKRKVKNSDSSTLRDSRYASIDQEYCKGCGVCAQVCPVRSIIMKK